jgi:iron complex outermembrane recepter protein
VNAYFDDDPFSNLHFFANVNGEGSHFTTCVTGAPNTAVCLTIIQNAPPGQAPSCAIYNNLPVSYVPNSTFNLGAYYGIRHNDKVLVEPRFWIDHLGSQHMFDNCGFSAAVGGCTNAVPSNQTMPSYTTTNLSFTGSPIKYLNLSISMKNLFNKKYNEYEYISSGGYFGVGSNYILAYPGAPLTTYGTVSFQF